jgi:hypothetical protein
LAVDQAGACATVIQDLQELPYIRYSSGTTSRRRPNNPAPGLASSTHTIEMRLRDPLP